MRKIVIPIVFIISLFISKLKAQNPFEKYGYHVKVLTMTNGKFNEFFDLDSIQQVGDVLINTHTMKVIGFAVKDSINPRPDAQLISRWISPDPMAEKYYHISPYAYCANDPIKYIDPNGMTIWIYYGTSEENMQRVEYRDGDLYNEEGEKYDNFDFGQDGGQYVALSLMALRKIQNGGDAGSDLIGSLQEEGFDANIYYGKNSAENNEANWNPFQQGKVLTTEGAEKPKNYIGLAHELVHLDDYKKGTIDLSEWYKSGEQTITNSEKYATHIENKIRAENKQAIRTHYGITDKSGKIIGGTGQITNGRISIFYKTEY